MYILDWCKSASESSTRALRFGALEARSRILCVCGKRCSQQPPFPAPVPDSDPVFPMGYFARTTAASGAVSSSADQVQFTAGANNVQSRTDTDVNNVTLHVDGGISCTGKLHIDEVEADTVVETSDPRKKRNMRSMTDADGDVALRYDPKLYELISKPGQLQAGVDAEAVSRVAPHAVRRNKKGDLAVSYRTLSMHTLQLVQRLHAELQELKIQQTQVHTGR
jgi:hypothetical protein